MKRILIALVLLTCGLSLWKDISVRQDGDQAAALNAANSLGPSFTVPADKDIADPQKFESALIKAAEASRVNVILTNAGYTADNRPFITQYVLLTGPTKLFDRFQLASGRWPSPAETRNSSAFVSSSTGSGAGQIGILRTFGSETQLAISPLASAYGRLPVASTYYTESRADTVGSFSDFLGGLAKQLTIENRLPTSLMASQLEGSEQQRLTFASASPNQLTWAIYALVSAIGFLSLYRTLALAKVAGVMRLQGFGRFRVWSDLHGRVVISAIAAGLAGQLIVTAAIRNIDTDFVFTVVRSTLALLAVTLLATIAAGVYQSRGRIAEQIKNRKDTKAPFYLNAVFLAVVGSLVVLMLGNVFHQYAGARAQVSTIGNWSKTSDYGIFYPTSVGNRLVEAQSAKVARPIPRLRLYTRI